MLWKYLTSSFFQSSLTSTIKLHGESERLLKKVLSFFVKSSLIKEALSSGITKIKYAGPVNQLSNQDLFTGDNTTALILHLEENKGESVAQFSIVITLHKKMQ